MDPQQELFTALLIAAREQGYDVYDGALPPEDTPYPFVYLADSRQADAETKDAVIGSVYQTIHVWHNSPRKRGAVSEMLGSLKTALPGAVLYGLLRVVRAGGSPKNFDRHNDKNSASAQGCWRWSSNSPGGKNL